VTFVEAPVTAEELARIPKAIPVPQLVNVVEGGKTPVLSAAEYGAMGFKIVLYANAALRVAVKGVRDVLSVLAAEGSTTSAAGAMVTWEERQRLAPLTSIGCSASASPRSSLAHPSSNNSSRHPFVRRRRRM